MELLRRGSRAVEPLDVFGRFDRLFDEWTKVLPFRGSSGTEDVIRIDEYREDDTLIIRADLPGIDPDEDVDLAVADGMLRITAERHSEEKTEAQGYLRRELRYGTFSRTLPLPDGVSESDIAATYKDGILEIRVPVPEIVEAEEPKKITVQRA